MASFIGELKFLFGAVKLFFNMVQLPRKSSDLILCLVQVNFKGFNVAVFIPEVSLGLSQYLFCILQPVGEISVVCLALFPFLHFGALLYLITRFLLLPSLQFQLLDASLCTCQLLLEIGSVPFAQFEGDDECVK